MRAGSQPYADHEKMDSWEQQNGIKRTNGDNSSYTMPSQLISATSAGRDNGSQPRFGANTMYSTQPSRSAQNITYASNPWANNRTANTPVGANGSREPQLMQSFNPAQLLNPRAAMQQNRLTASPQQNGYSNGTSPAPSLSFQFDSPAGSGQDSPHSHPSSMYDGEQTTSNGQNGFASYANGNGNGGMGSMLDRLHNVADRSMVPQKRRKVVDDREEDKKKAEFSGGGKGGILGQYMQDQRKEGHDQAVANGKVVDISFDDDEVQVVSNPADKEVCYGRIEGAEINAFKVPTPREGAVAISNSFWPQVKIQLRRRQNDRTNVIHAVDSTRNIIGCVDTNTALGLVPILDAKFSVRTAARVLTRQRRPNDPPPGSEVSARYGLDVNLYGPKKHAIQIGRHLSQKQLWLRTPLFVESGVELYNPHVIEKPAQIAQRPLMSYSSRQAPVRTTEEIRSDVLGMFDSLEKSESLPEMEPNHRITTELLKHQKQGLYFMTMKEKERIYSADEKGNSSLWRLNISGNGQRSYFNVITGQEERKSPPQVLGGILADMMGLGKTLSILSLVTATLDDRALEWAQLQPAAEADNRDLCCSKKGKTALPKIEQAPLSRNCKTTLLVSPLSTIANWEEQIKQHVKPGALKYYIYHGSGRIKDVNKLAQFDLVITTYGSVASEFNNRSKQKHGVYPLEEMNWFRIVLDEAHMIREQSTQQSKAICRLQASRRWAVTGTPVQNKLEDLGALMTFLRVKPFDEKGGFAQYIMAPFKMCDPEILPKLRLLVDSITLRRLKDRIDLPQRRDELVKLDFSPAERHLYDVFAKNASDRVKVIVNQREKSLGGRTYVHILQSILRLRLICAHGEDLLGEEDLEVMKGLNQASAIELDSDDEDDRPALSAKQAYDMYQLMIDTNADLCSTCSRKVGVNDNIEAEEGETKEKIIGFMTPCFHIICPNCFDGFKAQMDHYSEGRTTSDCIICRQHIKLSYFELKPGGLEEGGPKSKGKKQTKTLENYHGPHTKTKALIQDLNNSRMESEILHHEAPIKSVVFSGWTAHLDLIQLALNANNIKYCRLDGKMTRAARGAAMDAFRDDPSILVILVSITAGGLGLNLTSANKVYVMEPQYNPAAEAQAIDRVHRLGQKREVTTVRYIMNDSFEEKMLELQDKKRKLASISMDGEKGRMDKVDAARKRLEDLRSLFK
ncbi:P-loop containing nucleoside triphosphate hydrolase [Glarea lozoyensis ATCC 20868]|uniref:p-loop containing nucleoside triphosphate hydrolase n=1 Tax=Glarea lozoyensis (strain ATCC 20868 / MF5171) TaxID=1116229 RepID=S3DH05_GLAL2|nr:P-loop containing nucleoside triphosphate hydrolase [Glarea lozoyensis ATCC 20868]EPE31291.1 P-loop containing nucleoside triphosphate hydrolase [Glarea lozoyensis ATCC 20868]